MLFSLSKFRHKNCTHDKKIYLTKPEYPVSMDMMQGENEIF